MRSANFIHLHCHTEYSITDGLVTIPGLIAKASQLKMPAVAVTDLGNLYGTVKFYQQAYKAGVKPIIAADLRIRNDANADEFSVFTFLCQSNQGYKNLLKLVSKSFLEGQISGKPIIDKEWLIALSEGLIVLSGGEESEIGQALLAHEKGKIKGYLKFWKAHFPDRFYIEVRRIGKPLEEDYIAAAVQFAEKYALPLVATNDVRFLDRADFEAHEARVCIQEGMTLTDPHRSRHTTDQQYLRSPDEMQDLFSDLPEALINTVEIAKRCNVTFQLGTTSLPYFPVPAGYSTESFLSEEAGKGLEDRLHKLFDVQSETFKIQSRPYDQRLKRELDVINSMGFAGYFLIVADFTRWAKENDIPVGPGRGSGAGSLVAYALKITDLDPIALDLLFERFLNLERVSLPDFDIDFCMDGRDRVIEYVMQKHGHDSVSQIITYGTMMAKAVVRDVGRVLALPYGFVDKIAKLIPFELGMTLTKAIEQEPLLRERYEQEEEVRTLIDLAKKLEGITRSVGKHAGGIVIAPGKLTDFVPLYCEPNEATHPVTQFDKDDVEAVGLVKFDFLGLKTLTIIHRALNVINDIRSKNNLKPIDINLIPLNDQQAFALLKAGKSTAVFQLESHGMRDLINRLQPDCFEDLMALVALFRPGPLQSGMVDDYINRKHGRARVMYPHPRLEPVLRTTYGVILFQEQVMQIAQVLAGYTLGAADILRHAMGKKKTDEMAKQREIFCNGAVANGVNKDIATHIFDSVEKFAGYGFNKAHSASYALIAYQTAWLKTHYPAAFMAAVLSSDMDRTEKIITLLDECQALKLHVFPPDINKSDYFFKMINEKELRYGLGAVKGLGESAIENIVAAREQGPFKDIFDFCQRIDLRKMNKRVFEVLVKSGCFDSLDKNRAKLMASLTKAISLAEQTFKNKTFGQHDLLADETEAPQYIDAKPWKEELQLQYEKETLGFYLSGHPLNHYLNELTKFTTCRISDLHHHLQQNVRTAGIIAHVRIRQTKRGDRLAVVKIDDGSTHIEMVCFSDIFHKHRALLNEEQLIVIDGEVSLDEFNKNLRLICRDLYTIAEARERFAKYLQIQLYPGHVFDVKELKRALNKYLGGTCPVVLRFIRDGIQAQIKLGKEWLIKPEECLFSSLQKESAIEKIEFMY